MYCIYISHDYEDRIIGIYIVYDLINLQHHTDITRILTINPRPLEKFIIMEMVLTKMSCKSRSHCSLNFRIRVWKGIRPPLKSLDFLT